MTKLTQTHLDKDRIWSSAIEAGELVYAMRQVHNLKVAGMKSKDKKFYSAGICLGISIQWIRLRKNKKDYANQNKICNEVSLLALIIQQKYMKSDIPQIIKSQGLKYTTKKLIHNFSGQSLISASPTSGKFAIFCSQYHAMAMQATGTTINFLDPNYGHFKLKSTARLQSFLQRITLTEKYQFPYETYKIG